jgi:hypothetical protein
MIFILHFRKILRLLQNLKVRLTSPFVLDTHARAHVHAHAHTHTHTHMYKRDRKELNSSEYLVPTENW